MKVRVEMDLTPEEARHVMGLPDLSATQARLVAEFERRMMAALEKTEPEAMLKQWVSLGNQSFEQFQRFLWDSARTAAGSSRKETPKTQR
jgi:hypothetical protein